MSEALDRLRDHRGKLPSFAFPGGYPIIYYTSDWDPLCADCADTPDKCTEPAVRGDAYYEGPSEFCAECNKAMPSAYGDPDSPDDTQAV